MHSNHLLSTRPCRYYNDIITYRDRFAMGEEHVSQLAMLNMKNDAHKIVQTQVAPNAERIRRDIEGLISEKTTQLSAKLATQSARTKGIVVAIVLISILIAVQFDILHIKDRKNFITMENRSNIIEDLKNIPICLFGHCRQLKISITCRTWEKPVLASPIMHIYEKWCVH